MSMVRMTCVLRTWWATMADEVDRRLCRVHHVGQDRRRRLRSPTDEVARRQVGQHGDKDGECSR